MIENQQYFSDDGKRMVIPVGSGFQLYVAKRIDARSFHFKHSKTVPTEDLAKAFLDGTPVEDKPKVKRGRPKRATNADL